MACQLCGQRGMKLLKSSSSRSILNSSRENKNLSSVNTSISSGRNLFSTTPITSTTKTTTTTDSSPPPSSSSQEEKKKTHYESPRAQEAKLKVIRDRMIRVDHAGEYGANRIYAGQMAVLGKIQCFHIRNYKLP